MMRGRVYEGVLDVVFFWGGGLRRRTVTGGKGEGSLMTGITRKLLLLCVHGSVSFLENDVI